MATEPAAVRYGVMLCVDRERKTPTPTLVYCSWPDITMKEGYVQDSYGAAWKLREKMLAMFPKNFYAVVEITITEVA